MGGSKGKRPAIRRMPIGKPVDRRPGKHLTVWD